MEICVDEIIQEYTTSACPRTQANILPDNQSYSLMEWSWSEHVTAYRPAGSTHRREGSIPSGASL
jgi:hypothetical protein